MATKLPSGKYRTQVLIDGEKRKYKSFIGSTAKEADMRAEQWKAANKAGIGAGTFGACANSFLAEMDGILSPSTMRTYRSILKNLPAAFKELPMADIKNTDLYRVYHLLKTPKTIRNYHGFISSVYSYKGLNAPKLTLPEKRKADIYIPTEADIRRLTRAVAGTPLEIPVALGVRGMRRGEICAVRKEDIDGNILHIRRAVVYDGKGYVTKGPKTAASDRYIPIPEDIAEKIKEAGVATTYTPEGLSCVFRRALKKHGLPHFRFHDLRHAFVSIAHANNIPDSYVQSLGGWATNYTLRNVYQHSFDDRLKEYSQKMEDILTF